MNLKEAAAFLAFITSGAAMDSDRRIFVGIIFLTAAAVLYGQAKGKGKNEKDSVMENSGSSAYRSDYI